MIVFSKLSVKNKLMVVVLLTNALVLLAVGAALIVNEAFCPSPWTRVMVVGFSRMKLPLASQNLSVS